MIGTGSLPVHIGGKEGTPIYGGTAGSGSGCIGEACGGKGETLGNEKECGGEYYFTATEHSKGLNSCGSIGRQSWRQLR
jgi:hypothetical protein